MRLIHKYVIPATEKVLLPVGAVPLHVALQQIDVLCVWALVETEAPTQMRQFAVVPTGSPIMGHGIYVGTFHTHDHFIFHVFDHGAI